MWAPPSVQGTAQVRSRELTDRLRDKFRLDRLEAEFVVLVGRNGGLCLVSQVEAWRGQRGLPATESTAIRWLHGLHDKLGEAFTTFRLEREGARSVQVHQFVGRKLYRELGMEASRWRRRAEMWSTPVEIKRRLVGVGAVLGRWWYPWLGSAEASVAWCDALGIDRAVLPQTRYRLTDKERPIYFPDRSPHAGDGSLCLFVCPLAVQGRAERESLGKWGRSYAPLWEALGRVGVQTAVVVAGCAQTLMVPVAELLRDWEAFGESRYAVRGIWFDTQVDYALAGNAPAVLEARGESEGVEPGVATWRRRAVRVGVGLGVAKTEQLVQAWRSPRAAELDSEEPGWWPVEGLPGVKAGPREAVTVASLLLDLGGPAVERLWRVRRRRATGNGSHGLAGGALVGPRGGLVSREPAPMRPGAET